MSPDEPIGLSIFLPVFNEAENVGPVIRAALEVAPSICPAYEVIVVDDGSSDATEAVVRELASRNAAVRYVPHPRNRGYGAAIKTGLQSARYSYVFFTDGDGQFYLTELPGFVRPILDGEADVMIGYRNPRRDPLFRGIAGKCWCLLVRVVLGLRARDVDCAFKAMRTALVRGMALETEGACISAELLCQLELMGCRIVERPVKHRPRLRGKATGGNPRVILRAFRELYYLSHAVARLRKTGARSDRVRGS